MIVSAREDNIEHDKWLCLQYTERIFEGKSL